MAQWPVILSAVGGVFGVIAAGAVARRLAWLTEEVDATLLRLCIGVLFPCFFFDVLLENPALEDARNIVLPPVVGFLATATGFAAGVALAYTVGPKLGLTTPAMRRTFVLTVGMFNYGYVPIPLVEAIFSPTDGGATLGVLVVHNVGVDLAMWSLGVLIVSGAFVRGWWKRMINPPTVAIVAALTINAVGLPDPETAPTAALVSDTLRASAAMLGACAIPTALVLIGATITDELRKADLRQGWGVMAAGCTLRLGVLPLVFLGAAWALRDTVSPELRRVIAVEAAMPTAVFPVLLARLYGGDPGTAMRVALATSLVGLVTIPLWLMGGLAWLGLGVR